MKGIEIRDFCGDYALDIPMGDRSVYTIYFNSYRNAETVKRIMEVDDSVPNAATVCDMVEVVRCKNCTACDHCYPAKALGEEAAEGWYCKLRKTHVKPYDFCSYGERKEQT